MCFLFCDTPPKLSNCTVLMSQVSDLQWMPYGGCLQVREEGNFLRCCMSNDFVAPTVSFNRVLRQGPSVVGKPVLGNRA